MISPKALSDALAALGAYAAPPTDAQLAAAELAEGRDALTVRLSNALYGSAAAHGDAQGLAEFAVVVAELAPAYTRVVELVAVRRGDTIEALHAKSDLEVGMEALLGGPLETGADGRDVVGDSIFDERSR